MFKHLTEREQLKNANIELARLRAFVGKLPQQEIVEGEEVEQITISSEIEQTKANLEYVSIMTGVDL